MSQISQPGAHGFLLHIQTRFPLVSCRELGWLLGAPVGARPAQPRCPNPEVPSIPGGAGLCPSLICLQ